MQCLAGCALQDREAASAQAAQQGGRETKVASHHDVLVGLK